MALKIEAEHGVTRQDFFLMDVADIVVDEGLRGRHAAPSKKKIHNLAVSIMEHGQIQAVEGRRLPDKRVQLVFGYTRYEAVKLINEELDPANPRQIKVSVSTCNAEEAFVKNVVENKHRNETSAIDDAHNQRRLREDYGKTQKEIASLYQCTASWVSQLSDLLQLPTPVQRIVHEGLMPATAARLLVGADEDVIAKVLAEAKDERGNYRGSSVKAVLRDIAEEEVEEEEIEEEEEETEPSSKLNRSMRELKDFLNTATEAEDSDPHVVRFVKDMQGWLGGQKSDRQLANALHRLLEAEPTPEIDTEEMETDAEDDDDGDFDPLA